MVRLVTEIWVKAYIHTLSLNNIPAFITAKGDLTAGAVLVKLATLDGAATLYARSTGPEGNRMWSVLKQGPEFEVDDSIRKQRDFDPDLWVVEVESRDGRHMLDEFSID